MFHTFLYFKQTRQSLSVYLSICLSVNLSICLSVNLSIRLSVYLSICLSFYLSICLSVYLSIYLSSCLAVYISICVSVCMSICLSVYPSIFLSICLSSHLSIYLSFYLISIYLPHFKHPLNVSLECVHTLFSKPLGSNARNLSRLPRLVIKTTALIHPSYRYYSSRLPRSFIQTYTQHPYSPRLPRSFIQATVSIHPGYHNNSS